MSQGDNSHSPTDANISAAISSAQLQTIQRKNAMPRPLTCTHASLLEFLPASLLYKFQNHHEQGHQYERTSSYPAETVLKIALPKACCNSTKSKDTCVTTQHLPPFGATCWLEQKKCKRSCESTHVQTETRSSHKNENLCTSLNT